MKGNRNSPDADIRVRFGVKLSWPVQNAATFVAYVDQKQFDGLYIAISMIRSVLPDDVKNRAFIEIV